MSLTDAEVQQRDVALPKGWTRTKFGEIYELVYGKSLTKAARNTDGHYPVYGSSGIVDHHDTFLVEGPAIVVGRKGAAGAVTFSTGPCWPIDTTYYVRDCKHLSLRYSFYFLTSLRLDQFDRSTAIPGLNRDDAYELVVLLPPLAEQRRIVAKIEELFSELDKGVENLEKARKQLKVYRQAVLQHTFEGKLTAQWREENKNQLENPEQLLARLKQSREARYEQQVEEWKALVIAWEETGNLGKKPSRPRKKGELPRLVSGAIASLPKLPNGYVYTHLSNLGELGRGKSKHRPRNAPELFGGAYPFVQTGEVKAAGREIKKYSKTYSDFGLEQSKLWPKGTLCVTIAANIAETAFLGFDGCFPDSVVGFKAAGSLVLPAYVEFFIKSVRARIEAYAPATAQKNINLTTLENLIVPLCSLPEQQAIVTRLEASFSAMEQQKETIDEQLRKSAALRQSILKKAFSGQLVAQDPNDEPASALLDRIKAQKVAQSQSAKLRKTHRRAKATA